MRYVLAWVGAVLLGGCGLPLGSSSNNGSGADGGTGGGGGTGGTGASCAWLGPVVIDEKPSRADYSIHVVGNDRILVNTDYGLSELDCASWSLVPVPGLPDTNAAAVYELSDHGLAVVASDGVTFIGPDLKVERQVPYPTGIGQWPSETAIDGHDNVWMLGQPPDCMTNAPLGVLTRAGGRSAGPLSDQGVLLTNRTDCASTPHYQVSIQGTAQGGLLVLNGGTTGGTYTSQTLPRTLFERCERICDRLVFGTEQCFETAPFTNATHCPGICHGSWTQATIECLDVAADCTAAAACTITQKGDVVQILAVSQLSATSAGEISYGELRNLSSARYDSGTSIDIWRRDPILRRGTTEAHSGLVLWNSFWEPGSSGINYYYGRFESWDPVSGELLWNSQVVKVHAQGLGVNSILEGERRVYAQLFANKADDILGVSEVVVTAHADRTQSDGAMAALPSLLAGYRAFRELSDGGFLAGVRDGTRLLLQRFDVSGNAVAGTSGGSTPICNGSRSFTALGQPCYLASGLTANQYQCTSDSSYKYSYRCNPTTCLFEGQRCLPCENGCSPCVIGIGTCN